MRHPQKEFQEQEGLGQSCGGFSSKIHGLCDALGNPLDFVVTAGQRHDASWAIPLIAGVQADALLADKGYDRDEIRLFAKGRGVAPHIPLRSNREEDRPYDEQLYKEQPKYRTKYEQPRGTGGMAL